jgi:hypothetical protein
VIAMLSLLFSSCDKCKLANEHTLNISWTQPVIHNTASWSGISQQAILEEISTSLNENFDQPKQLMLVQSGAEYFVTIDSVFCSASESIQNVGDPCWKSGGAVHDIFFPQPEYSYTLHSSSINICFTIKDTVNHFEEAFTASGGSSEYLYQQTGDSLHCYQYEVRGGGGLESDVDMATKRAYCDFKCIINKWLHGRL